jgi:hypothetical protein
MVQRICGRAVSRAPLQIVAWRAVPLTGAEAAWSARSAQAWDLGQAPFRVPVRVAAPAQARESDLAGGSARVLEVAGHSPPAHPKQ